jgi:hypothetical protein
VLETPRHHEALRRLLVAQAPQGLQAHVPFVDLHAFAQLDQRGLRRVQVVEPRPDEVHGPSLCCPGVVG